MADECNVQIDKLLLRHSYNGSCVVMRGRMMLTRKALGKK